jgi:nitrite reductase (NADH) small subunit
MEVTLCSINEIHPGEMRAHSVDGRALLIIRAKHGEFYVIKNACPHQGAALHCGSLDGTMKAAGIWEYKRDFDKPVVRCPWHNYEIDASTGHCVTSARLRVKKYESWVDGEYLKVNV